MNRIAYFATSVFCSLFFSHQGIAVENHKKHTYDPSKTLLIATHNSAKFAEIKKLLGNIPYEIISLADLSIDYDVEETGRTFKENAILKAKTYCSLSGLPTIADDSGLEIEALHGEPGIYTNRYAGLDATEDEKREFLLKKMAEVPEGKRQARFTVFMVLALPSGKIVTTVGYLPGRISQVVQGAPIKKFPYRSIFIPNNIQKTLAQLIEEGSPTVVSPRAEVVANIRQILLGQP